jgi:hypothetical protein
VCGGEGVVCVGRGDWVGGFVRRCLMVIGIDLSSLLLTLSFLLPPYQCYPHYFCLTGRDGNRECIGLDWAHGPTSSHNFPTYMHNTKKQTNKMTRHSGVHRAVGPGGPATPPGGRLRDGRARVVRFFSGYWLIGRELEGDGIW